VIMDAGLKELTITQFSPPCCRILSTRLPADQTKLDGPDARRLRAYEDHRGTPERRIPNTPRTKDGAHTITGRESFALDAELDPAAACTRKRWKVAVTERDDRSMEIDSSRPRSSAFPPPAPPTPVPRAPTKASARAAFGFMALNAIDAGDRAHHALLWPAHTNMPWAMPR